MLATTHIRALCLALIESSASTSPNTDMDRAEHARHWARTGLQFIILGELDEGERCLDASGARLRQMNEPESVEVLEYPELGMEAVWKIQVENFPAFIVVDDKGNDFFAKWSV